jgi:hypothetical protein
MRRSPVRCDRHLPGLRMAMAVVLPALVAACAGAARPGLPNSPVPELDLSDFVDVEVATVAIDLGGGQPLALLHQDWQRILPVWVGNEQALAIARAQRGIPVSRPLTHDLFANVLEGLGGTWSSTTSGIASTTGSSGSG